jgi:hypothetical protein
LLTGFSSPILFGGPKTGNKIGEMMIDEENSIHGEKRADGRLFVACELWTGHPR